VSSARNIGVQNSKFEWIAFLDGDDIWKESHLEVLREMITKFPNYYFFCTSFEYSDLRPFPRNNRVDRFTLIVNYFKDVLTEHLVWTSCVAVNKEAFNKIKGFREDLSLGEDFDVWHKLVNNGFYLVKANDITAIYRIGAENRSDSKRYNLGRSFLLTLNLKTTNKYEKKYYYLNIWKKVKMFIVTKDFGNLFRLLLKVIKG
jgi:GT2 family glycosyltransferase